MSAASLPPSLLCSPAATGNDGQPVVPPNLPPVSDLADDFEHLFAQLRTYLKPEDVDQIAAACHFSATASGCEM